MKKILSKYLQFLPLFVLTLFLGSCSSVISKEDCKRDMKSFGFTQGKLGLSNLSEDIRKACVTSNETVDLAAYQAGFKIGWSDFCTSFHGFEMGKRGDIYKSFCPAEKEELFHEKFFIGKKVYEKNDQLRELEEKIKDITPGAEKDLTSREELTRFQGDLRDIKREIQSLEQQGMSLIHTN